MRRRSLGKRRKRKEGGEGRSKKRGSRRRG